MEEKSLPAVAGGSELVLSDFQCPLGPPLRVVVQSIVDRNEGTYCLMFSLKEYSVECSFASSLLANDPRDHLEGKTENEQQKANTNLVHLSF